MKIAIQILAFLVVLFCAVSIINVLIDAKRAKEIEERLSYEPKIEQTSIYKLKRIDAKQVPYVKDIIMQPAHWWAK